MQVPPGAYRGIKRALGVSYMGKIEWQSPQYFLELPDAPGSQFLSTEVEVTGHVEAGSVILKRGHR